MICTNVGAWVKNLLNEKYGSNFEKMEKRDIAIKQIRAAAKLYNQGEYICSITLSGAAEEILGRIAKKRTTTNQLENEILFVRDIYEYLSGQSPNDTALIRQINRVKNELKHNDSGINEWVEADFEFEASRLFIRAVKNYYDSYKEFPKDRTITILFNFLTL
jgi:hypothetical protein